MLVKFSLQFNNLIAVIKMQNHKLKFHSSCFFKFSNFCKISRAPAISLQAAANFPAAQPSPCHTHIQFAGHTQGITGSNSCWRPFLGHIGDFERKKFIIRRIFQPSFENRSFFCLIFIGNIPNKVFLSLFFYFR